MTGPVGTPHPGEALWLDNCQLAAFHDEPTPTKVEVLLYYTTQTGRVTRATVENTTTRHQGRVVVFDRRNVAVFDDLVPPSTPPREYDLSGMNLTVRANDQSDPFSISLGVM